MTQRSLLITPNNLVRVALLAAALLASFACGDDDASDSKSNTGRDGGAAGRDKAESKGGGGSGGSAPIKPLPDQTAGKDCSTNKDCATGTCLIIFEGSFGGGMMEAPGGYCSSSCLMNTDCGEGGTCSGAFAGAPGRCLKSCMASSECRDGYRCVNALGMADRLPTLERRTPRAVCSVRADVSPCGNDEACRWRRREALCGSNGLWTRALPERRRHDAVPRRLLRRLVLGRLRLRSEWLVHVAARGWRRHLLSELRGGQ